MTASPPTAPATLKFAAMRYPGYRAHFTTYVLAMMADNIEHVISYWMMFQKFHSPALGGFAVVSHWLPFLLFSVPVGALADRIDPRRLIQLGMLLFMTASLGWGWFFITDSLQMWHAMLLLVIHGCAGVLWQTSSQLLLHDIVPTAELQSAVRLNATARYLGVLVGPAVGGAMLLGLGPSHGILLNTVFYLPLLLWLWKAPYGPRFRHGAPAPKRAVRGLADITQTMRDIADKPVIVSMILMAGAASFFIGNSYQAQMPNFAQDLGHGDPGSAYSMLLAADAAGALVAGFILESSGLLRASARTALLLATVWCVALASFALVRGYALALALLFTAGFFELSFSSMAQTLVQLNAPADIRGRVIGLFNMSALGLRTFAGITVGLGGTLVGVHHSLAFAALALLLTTVWQWLRLGRQADVASVGAAPSNAEQGKPLGR
jgi:MFS family permease